MNSPFLNIRLPPPPVSHLSLCWWMDGFVCAVSTSCLCCLCLRADDQHQLTTRAKYVCLDSQLLFLRVYAVKPIGGHSSRGPLRWRQRPGVVFQVYFREERQRRGLQGDFFGDKCDQKTERVFVCHCPTLLLRGPFLSPLTSLSVPWPVGAGRLKVMTPFSPLSSLRTLQPINFHSAFSKILAQPDPL